MTSTAKWTSYGSPDTLMVGASMNALGLAAYASSAQNSGAPIDNTTTLALYMDIGLTLSSAVTCGSGAAFVSVWLIPSLDGGTSYPTPPGTSATAPPAGMLAGNIQAVAGASFTSGVLRGVVIPPGKYHTVMQNNLGVAFPSTGNTLLGYRYGEQAV